MTTTNISYLTEHDVVLVTKTGEILAVADASSAEWRGNKDLSAWEFVKSKDVAKRRLANHNICRDLTWAWADFVGDTAHMHA